MSNRTGSRSTDRHLAHDVAGNTGPVLRKAFNINRSAPIEPMRARDDVLITRSIVALEATPRDRSLADCTAGSGVINRVFLDRDAERTYGAKPPEERSDGTWCAGAGVKTALTGSG